MDVQACKFVVQFDKMTTTKSYIQSRGRARKLDSDFILFVEVEDSTYQKKILDFQKYNIRFDQAFTQDSILSLYLNSAEIIMIGQTARELDDAMEIDGAAEGLKDEEPPYLVETTGATANLLSSVQLINQYAQTIPSDGYTSNKLQWEETDLGGTFIKNHNSSNKFNYMFLNTRILWCLNCLK